MPLPSFPLSPMKAIAAGLPSDDAGWVYEVKWDGMRIVAFVGEDGATVLQSANRRDVTVSFPELAGLAAATAGHPAVLDGEVVALDASGRPSFGRLQHRMHLDNPREVASRAAEVPVAYQIFDLLGIDDLDATPLPYADRRRLLADLVGAGPHWSVPAYHVGDGQALLDTVRDLGLEGLIAKRLDSRYEPGRRSRAWLKVKVRRQQELVVGGWQQGEGRRQGQIGSLLLGYHAGDGTAPSPGSLRYAGKVGTGFTGAELDRLARLLAPLSRAACPFEPPPPAPHRKDPHRVEPRLVIEVAYGEWTVDGLLRHPSYLGQRDDKDPEDVTRAP
jgi:bifunctional non-homologous end joining protein LigD